MSRDLTPVSLSEGDLKAQRSQYLVDQRGDQLRDQDMADSIKRFKYLIGLTDLFRHFIDARAEKDEDFRKFLADANLDSVRSTPGIKNGSDGGRRKRKTEKQEDAELVNDEEDEQETTVFTESPGYINGTLRPYQIEGLNWMVSLYENNISGILADEMGLGKTLQTISFLGYLRYIRGVAGPHLVLVPKSTLGNWEREFHKWCPEVSTVVIQGDKDTRADLLDNRLLNCDFDVCITSYEIVLREKAQFKKFAWQYIVIDEAHRIKNEQSQLSQVIRILNSRNRLLVTGTPLQNNLHELWALLNFLLPDVFSDSSVFDQWFESQEGGDNDKIVQQLHKVLRPFLLRRVKADVEHTLLPKKEVNLYVPMSAMQRTWYQKILERDIAAVNGAVGSREKSRLLNIVMQLRKCCNHPYLFDGAEPGPPFTTDEHLVANSGKLAILDKLLKKAKENGSRVLIFSQMSRVLDIMEDYCYFRGHKYCRIDGQTDHEVRLNMIDEYNRPGSDKFIFLLTTRAGGLGINLVTADTVVLFDSDWNPQADLQAMDRAHRIGQTKQVYVYRLVTDNSIEEKVVERAAKKLRLDQLVIQQGRATAQDKAAAAASSKNELLDMIQHGAQQVFESTEKSGASKDNDGLNGSHGDSSVDDDLFDIDKLLSKGEERTAALSSKYQKLGLDELQRFDGGSDSYSWEGKDFKKKAGKIGPLIAPQVGKRGGESRIDDFSAYFARPSTRDGTTEKAPRAPKPPKQIHLQDFQFWPQRLYDLQTQEAAFHRRQLGYKVPPPPEGTENLEEASADQRLEQQEIDNAVALTPEELEEKKELSRRGFSNWTRREFTHFISLMVQFGRDSVGEIAENMPEKTELEVKTYHEVFWRRYKEIELWERYMSLIDAGKEKAERLRAQEDMVKRKVEACEAPMQQLTFDLLQGSGKRVYTEDEDRFLLMQLYNFGLDAPNLHEQIREAIRESPLFRFDWFFLSRSPIELGRRCQTILSAVQKEFERPSKKAKH